VGLRIPGGVGVRVGTRGVSLRTPIARQSIALSGFRSTIGAPGIAHVTVNATRPSITAGVGPARATLSKNPGVALTSRFVAVGVTSKPLLWARVGPVKLQVPGQLQRSTGRRWYDEIDDHWTPFYARRPPSISAQLHQIIVEMESGAVVAATRSVSVPEPSGVVRQELDAAAVEANKKAYRKEARRQANFLARHRRKADIAEAAKRHDEWVRQQRETIAAEHQRLSTIHDEAITAWGAGDPAAVYVVTNALLTASGAPGALVSLVDGAAILLVFAPALEDVHPSGPSYSSGGSPTIKKRTKAERRIAHWTLSGANTVQVLNTAKAALRGVERADVVVVTMSSSTGDLADSPVIATFTADLTAIPRDAAAMVTMIDRGALARPKPLHAVLGDGFAAEHDTPAIAVLTESRTDLASPHFWLEVSTAVEAIRSAPPEALTAAPKPSPHSSGRINTPRRTQARQPVGRRSVPVSLEARLEGLLEELSYLDSAATVLAHWPIIERSLACLQEAQPGQVAEEIITEMLFTLNVSVAQAGRAAMTHELAQHADRLNLGASVTRTLRAHAWQADVEGHETALRDLLERAHAAVSTADASAVTAAVDEFIGRLPDVPSGADDEAEDVARVLIAPAAALELTTQRDELVRLLPTCGKDVQNRLAPLVEELGMMLVETQMILEHIRANSGCLQSKIANELQLDKARVRWAMWNLAHFARVDRVKKGSSYLVSYNNE
jgi:hypothetical protein